MKSQIEKYVEKLVSGRVAERSGIFAYTYDDEISYFEGAEKQFPWEKLFDNLNITGLIFCKLSEPLKSIVNEVTDGVSRIFPEDWETRAFIHDIMVVEPFDMDGIINALKKRKGVIIRGEGILTRASRTLEQAYVYCSSMVHSLVVKYFVDFYFMCLNEESDIKDTCLSGLKRRIETFYSIDKSFFLPEISDFSVSRGPFYKPSEIMKAMVEAGKMVVKLRLVDSYFGNISYFTDNFIYISQTASSLDELEGCIDSIPIFISSGLSITSSSELPVHLGLGKAGGYRAIIHAHPKFAVITSMCCDKKKVCGKDCYTACRERRNIDGIPVVTGEIGAVETITKITGGCRESADGCVIGFGHGIFACGEEDFRKPLETLIRTEKLCFDYYFRKVDERIKKLSK